ncbi:MAG: hypothetical protein IPK83_17630 [Planctomycetes bacterium]|nr:hypothetical protein [Planctomycetota bacterium]
MTDFTLGILGFFVQILSLAVQSFFEFVVNPLLTFFVDGFITDSSTLL